MRRLISPVLVLMLVSPAVMAADNLASAAEKGKVALIRQLAGDGANVNERYDVGQTPLMLAAKAGQLKSVQALIELGADLKAQDNNGDTALHLAATYEEVRVMK